MDSKLEDSSAQAGGNVAVADEKVSVLRQLFAEALSWGMTYGPVLSRKQWDEMREKQAAAFEARAVSVNGTRVEEIADALEACDWGGVSIGNKAIIKRSVELLRAYPKQDTESVAVKTGYARDSSDQFEPTCEREVFDEKTETEKLHEWVRQRHEPRMGKHWVCVLYPVNHGNEIQAAWLERARRAFALQPVVPAASMVGGMVANAAGKVHMADLVAILREAAQILSGNAEFRWPIVDELDGFAYMLAETQSR